MTPRATHQDEHVAVARAVVFLYHRVAECSVDPFDLCVPPETFEAQMRQVQDHYDVVPLRELWPATQRPTSSRWRAALTFDDGYLDNLTTASPLLAARGLPATFFVTTRHLDTSGEYWWDALTRIVFSTSDDDNRTGRLLSLHRELMPLPADQRETRLARLADGIATVRASARPMVRHELSALAGRPGHDIGNHTADHLALRHATEEECRFQIASSRALLEACVQRSVTELAYPFGDAVEHVWRAAETEGVTLGLAAKPGILQQSSNRLMVPRVPITGDTIDLSPARLLAGLNQRPAR